MWSRWFVCALFRSAARRGTSPAMAGKSGDRGVALVTGASSGIGEEIAKRLALEGFDLVLVARREDRLKELATQLEREQRTRAHVVVADLSSLEGAKQLTADIARLGLEITVLVNNAGFGVHGNLADVPIERTLEMVQLNVVSLTFLTQHYVKEMVSKGRGRILQISSIGAFQPSPYYAVYSATKAFVLSMSEALHYELQGTGVTCTTSCPGLTATEFHKVADHEKPDWMNSLQMTAQEVARISVSAMLRGDRVTVPGPTNWLTAVVAQIMPKSLVIPMAAATMRKSAN